MHENSKITALYARLSRDDGGDAESNSISTQKDMLSRYAAEHGFRNPRFFIDDGYSGSTFQRPAVKEMLAEVQKGNVSTIIVKDMSRFGRNYLEVGLHTDITFPRHDVRFIALVDGVDSQNGVTGFDFTPFRNIINEFYCADTSKKIRTSLRNKALAGGRAGGHPPFGYLRDPQTKTLVVDETAAEVIREIFHSYLNGKSKFAIVKDLQGRGVPPPSIHMKSMGMHTSQVDNTQTLFRTWSLKSITTILSRRDYLGHTISQRMTRRSYKDKRLVVRPEEEWVITENTHPAIIDEAAWNDVQRMLEKGKRREIKSGKIYPLNGLIFCEDCGNRAYVVKEGDGYNCGKYKCSSIRLNLVRCTSHFIKRTVVEEYVLNDLRELIAFATEREAEFVALIEKQTQKEKASATRKAKADLEKHSARIGEIDRIINRLYEDRTAGVLPIERFTKMLSEYETEQKDLMDIVVKLKTDMADEAERASKAKNFLALVKRYTNVEELTPEIAAAFIHKIYIDKCERKRIYPRSITIEYNIIGKLK